MSTIRDAHKIIVLKDGVVHEQGTHDELLKLNGVYAELHHIQFDAPAAAPATPDADRPPADTPSRGIRILITMSHTLIVLPDDSAKPLVDAINGAKRTLQIRMFLFTDPTMLQTVLAAKQRGVNVRVDAESGASRRHERQRARRATRWSPPKIEVRDSNPEFALTHQKSMVIDEDDGVRRVAQLGDARSHRDARLRRRHDARAARSGK